MAGRQGCLFGTSAAPFDSSNSVRNAMMNEADLTESATDSTSVAAVEAVEAIVAANDSAWKKQGEHDFPDGIAGS